MAMEGDRAQFQSASTSFDKFNTALVAAIHLRTFFCGIAFSLSGYPYKVSLLECDDEYEYGASFKPPTVILFDENKEFHSFGYEAADKYADIVMDNEQHKWYFFKHFISVLHDRQITRKMEIEDDDGKNMLAIDVFGAAMKYLKDCVFEVFGTMLRNSDIHWVFPVQAIWTDSAKQFMRESALKAGINEAQISLVLEPEAASLYCQMAPAEKIKRSKNAKCAATSPGTKHMVIDLGDKKANFSVQERLNDGGLNEIYNASKTDLGGAMVNEEFISMIVKILGGTFLSKFIDEHTNDYLDMQRALDSKIRSITPKTSRKIRVDIPLTLLLTCYETKCEEKIMKAIDSSVYAGKITWFRNKMSIDVEVFKNFFKPFEYKMVEHIKELLKHPDVDGTNIFLMVGVFSGSEMVQDAIMKAFPRAEVIIPHDPEFAVIKGAVMFGRHPMCITSRNCLPYDSTNLPYDNYIGS